MIIWRSVSSPTVRPMSWACEVDQPARDQVLQRLLHQPELDRLLAVDVAAEPAAADRSSDRLKPSASSLAEISEPPTLATAGLPEPRKKTSPMPQIAKLTTSSRSRTLTTQDPAF